MSKIKDGNYTTIQSFMVKDLGLKGNELLIYAVIYGFSQNEQKFSGSIQYLCDWTNSSKRSVLNNLQSLCEKGLIVKTDIVRGGVKFCEYRSKDFTSGEKNSLPGENNAPGGGEESSPWGGEESSPNNLSSYNLGIDKKEDTSMLANRHHPVFESFRDIYNSTCSNLPKCQVMTQKRKDAVAAFLKEFTEDQWQEICQKANQSQFLTGGGSRGWRADIDFLLKPDKAARILEGGYQDEKPEPAANAARTLDDDEYAAIQRMLKDEGGSNDY